jgi:hypothetical protein
MSKESNLQLYIPSSFVADVAQITQHQLSVRSLYIPVYDLYIKGGTVLSTKASDCAGLQILTAALVKIAVFWYMTPCDSLLKMTSEWKSYIATNEKLGEVYEHLAQEWNHTTF